MRYCKECSEYNGCIKRSEPQDCEYYLPKKLTNFDRLKSLTVEEFAAEMLMFRPPDSCFEDDNRNYSALDCTWHKRPEDAIQANIKYLNEYYE